MQYHCAMPPDQASAQLDFDAIGRALVALCGAQHALGHANASGTVRDYALRPDDAAAGFVWDMFAGEKGDADARWRLADFVKRHGLLDVIAEAVAR